LKAEGKKLSVSEIKDILIKNCINVPVSGFDKYSGYGIISAKRLFQGIETYKDMPKPTIWQDIEDEFERIF
jgi:hypothetical protein